MENKTNLPALITPSCPCYIADTGTQKGRGVFSARAITIGEIVEICPVILIEGSFDDLPSELQRVVFNWSFLAGMHGVHALALGYGSMYNHANPANLRYEASSDGSLLKLIAEINIERDSELTINYNAAGGGTHWHDNNWFDKAGITPYSDPSSI